MIRQKVRSLALVSFLLLLLLMVSGAIVSQAGIVTLPWQAPPAYRIAYLLAEDSVAADSPMAPARLEAALSAQAVFSDEELLELDKSTPVDAVVIHKSALSLVDKDWLASKYEHGVVVGVFNVYAPQLADLLDDPCIAEDGFASEPYDSDFYIVVSHLVIGSPQDVALIKASGFCNGRQVEGVQEEAHRITGRSTFSLAGDNDFNIFSQVLVSHIQSINEVHVQP